MTATDRARALAFLAGVMLAPDPRPGRAVLLGGADAAPVACDAYRPAARTPWGTVLFVHGMSLRAHRDPRVVVACNALAATGLQVLAPCVEGLCNLALDPATPKRIAELLLACGSDPALGNPPRVALASASFAAGLCLKAAARPDVRDRAGPLLLVGTYVDARALVAHLLTARDADPFGRLVLLRAFLDREGETSPTLSQVVDIALADASLRRDPPLLPDAVLRSHRAAIDDFSAVGDLAHVRGPVAFLHGRDDRVIPATESTRAAELLAGHGVPCRSWITAMLDHGDLSSPLGKVAELPRLLDLFAYWFGAVRRDSATSATAAHVDSSTTKGQYPIR